jgi:uncharacterized coiled-coil protein SlyX
MPFGMHQIQEEVLAPVIQNLMMENRIERLKIYNGIKDQKIDYLNQWHRDTEDFYGRNRAEAADLINRMRESYADYIRSLNTYKALQETQTAMSQTRSLDAAEVQQQNKDAEIIAGFELQARQFQQKQEEFANFMERLKDNIDEKAAQFGYIPYYEATLRDKEYRDMAQSAGQMQELEPRRKKLINVNPYVARHAKLPPQPNVEQKMYDDFAIDLLKEAAAAEEQPGDSAPDSVPDEIPEKVPEETPEAENIPDEVKSEEAAAEDSEEYSESEDEAGGEEDDSNYEDEEDVDEEDDSDYEDEEDDSEYDEDEDDDMGDR